MKENIEKLIRATIDRHKEMIAEFEAGSFEIIANIAEMISSSIKEGGCVYVCGNGGSAADAQHIAGELIGRFKRERKALPVVALTTDTSVITSISNDYSFDNIFTRQVEALVKKNDILWAISTSGSSARQKYWRSPDEVIVSLKKQPTSVSVPMTGQRPGVRKYTKLLTI